MYMHIYVYIYIYILPLSLSLLYNLFICLFVPEVERERERERERETSIGGPMYVVLHRVAASLKKGAPFREHPCSKLLLAVAQELQRPVYLVRRGESAQNYTPRALRTHILRILGPRRPYYVGLLGYLEP